LASAARGALQDPVNVIFVSSVTPWEMSMKVARGRLILSADVSVGLRSTGFDPLPVTWEHGVAAGALPPLHRDPFDRMLVAQARVEGLTIVTRDERVSQYDVPVLTA